MRNISKFAVIGALLLAVVMLVAPMSAQEGEGGVIVFGNFGSDVATLNPIYCTDAACNDVINYMYVGLVGVDPEIANWAAGVPNALADTMEISEDNLTYTLHLRDDLYWSDGVPITMDDILFKWEIITNPEYAYPYPYAYTDYIASVEALDDYTLQVTMHDAICGSVGNLTYLHPTMPAHIYRDTPPAELQNIIQPEVTSGAFRLAEWRTGEMLALSGWDDYPDATLGYVNPDGIVQMVVTDQTVLMEQFLAPSGAINMINASPPDRKADVKAAGEAGTHQVYTFNPGDSWDYMAFNMADPTNPQMAWDDVNANGVWDDGEARLDQGYHKEFTDIRVRQAFGHLINIDNIIQGAVFGEGTRMASYLVPETWAWNAELQPREYNIELGLQLLAEAGWVPQDPNAAPGPNNPLVCQGCLYAVEVDPAFEGSPFEFELLTNAGNTRRNAIGVIIQDELAQVGITVDFQAIDFNTLLDIMDAQTFDAYILGWLSGYPSDPDKTQLFGPTSDVPGSGSNITSFYNEEWNDLQAQALRVPGCALPEQKVYYDRMQEIMAEEMPYLWLYSQTGMYSVRNTVNGFDPYPQLIDWNIDVWFVSE